MFANQDTGTPCTRLTKAFTIGQFRIANAFPLWDRVGSLEQVVPLLFQNTSIACPGKIMLSQALEPDFESMGP